MAQYFLHCPDICAKKSLRQKMVGLVFGANRLESRLKVGPSSSFSEKKSVLSTENQCRDRQKSHIKKVIFFFCFPSIFQKVIFCFLEPAEAGTKPKNTNLIFWELTFLKYKNNEVTNFF